MPLRQQPVRCAVQEGAKVREKEIFAKLRVVDDAARGHDAAELVVVVLQHTVRKDDHNLSAALRGIIAVHLVAVGEIDAVFAERNLLAGAEDALLAGLDIEELDLAVEVHGTHIVHPSEHEKLLVSLAVEFVFSEHIFLRNSHKSEINRNN